MTKDRIHPIDRHVGERLRLARVTNKMSQTALGTAAGITFQQVQKYERGTNRVSASRLFEFANALGVDISYFFDGASDQPTKTRPTASRDAHDLDKIDMEIMRCLWEIDDDKLKRNLLRLVEGMRPGGKRREKSGPSASESAVS